MSLDELVARTNSDEDSIVNNTIRIQELELNRKLDSSIIQGQNTKLFELEMDVNATRNMLQNTSSSSSSTGKLKEQILENQFKSNHTYAIGIRRASVFHVLMQDSVDIVSIYEPRHDKTNKMSVRPAKTKISLGIRPV